MKKCFLGVLVAVFLGAHSGWAQLWNPPAAPAASGVAVSATPVGYSPGAATVEGHLAAIDAALMAPTNLITVALNSPGTTTATLQWGKQNTIRMLATNIGATCSIDIPAPTAGYQRYLSFSIANPNAKTLSYADDGNIYWASNGVYTVTARALGKFGRVSVASIGASKYEACMIATNATEIGYP